MLIRVDGAARPRRDAKDVILAIIGRIGTAGATGHVIEYAGAAIAAIDMAGRMTVCNMTIEAGARAGMIAPDEKTFAWLEGRPSAPQGAAFARRPGANGARSPRTRAPAYDAEVVLDAADIAPMVTWGTSPEAVTTIAGAVPDPAAETDPARRAQIERMLDYMGLTPGQQLAGLPIDAVFIGSCTNSRIEDLRAAAAIAHGRHVAPACPRAGRPRLGGGEAPGRRRRARSHLPRGRIRLARRGLLDVPRPQPRPARARRALRLDLQPQFRGAAGPGRAHPSRLAGDGRRGRDRRRAGRCADAGVMDAVPHA